MCNCRRLVILFFPGFWNNLLKITVVILTTFWICATHLKLFNAWLRGFTSAINLNEIIPSPGEMSTFPLLSETKTDKTQRSLPKPKIFTPQWPLGSMICHSWKPYSFPWVESRLFALKRQSNKGTLKIERSHYYCCVFPVNWSWNYLVEIVWNLVTCQKRWKFQSASLSLV